MVQWHDGTTGRQSRQWEKGSQSNGTVGPSLWEGGGGRVGMVFRRKASEENRELTLLNLKEKREGVRVAGHDTCRALNEVLLVGTGGEWRVLG